jgi:hypothetical protein
MKSAIIITFSTLLLAGCQTDSGATFARSLDRVVTSPYPLVLDFATSVSPDCKPTGPIQVRVITQPMHGQLKVTRTAQFPTYPTGNQREACNNRSVPGVRTVYTPRPGFSGEDIVVIETLFPSGKTHRATFNLSVR